MGRFENIIHIAPIASLGAGESSLVSYCRKRGLQIATFHQTPI